MTLNQLRAFLRVAALGTFSAAAADLAMTQPSVSELIKRMEESYGVRLFTRGARKLVLTSAGEQLLPYAQQAVDAAEGADRALRSLTSLTGGVATFGLLRNANYYFLSQLLETFHNRYPEVRLRIIGLNSVEVAEAVSAGELEAGLVVLPIDSEGLTVTPLMRDEVLFASADPRKTQKPATIESLAESDLVLYDAHYGWRDPTRRQLAERAQLAGITLTAQIELEHVETALGIVALGGGDTIVSSAVARSKGFPDGVHTIGFAEPLYDTIAIVQRRGSVLSPATREIARLARRMLLERA
ncbi:MULTISPECIES: LysR family transcriptional regulator [unclassified Frondihabitans]|jgi:DNA-binding transcriptional LysR family regulator|uniref:LysR family transcriptional regulator n=1 Tax=unclassified Frondihabitans TaxID=2626248 RepID=UPI000F4F0C62|nr:MULTISPECIES: LysR family transcriptional regulator [unclassified Frondihabitans]MBF4574591.1 LysR family transcriptional regulator [Frondihabitans sp. VKM Ac-2883]RPE76033.1 DNA-binding transcriptional LysR family regulator [Frondihabitans sp. PhB153]RPF05690.1 DNA-binding transcriptional LysR family regulator [Frondihabitans sp. PhB161]